MIAPRFVGYTCPSESQPELLVLPCNAKKEKPINIWLM